MYITIIVVFLTAFSTRVSLLSSKVHNRDDTPKEGRGVEEKEFYSADKSSVIGYVNSTKDLLNIEPFNANNILVPFSSSVGCLPIPRPQNKGLA